MTDPDPQPDRPRTFPDRPEWYETGERTYPDGRKRWRGWTWNPPARQRKRHEKTGETALKREAEKKAAQAEPPRFVGSRQLADQLDRERQEEEQKEAAR